MIAGMLKLHMLPIDWSLSRLRKLSFIVLAIQFAVITVAYGQVNPGYSFKIAMESESWYANPSPLVTLRGFGTDRAQLSGIGYLKVKEISSHSDSTIIEATLSWLELTLDSPMWDTVTITLDTTQELVTGYIRAHKDHSGGWEIRIAANVIATLNLLPGVQWRSIAPLNFHGTGISSLLDGGRIELNMTEPLEFEDIQLPGVLIGWVSPTKWFLEIPNISDKLKKTAKQ